jgi:hypothetical protein
MPALLPITHLCTCFLETIVMRPVASVWPIEQPHKQYNVLCIPVCALCHFDELFTDKNICSFKGPQSSPPWFSSLNSLIMSSIRRIVIAASVANYRRPQRQKNFRTVLMWSCPNWITWVSENLDVCCNTNQGVLSAHRHLRSFPEVLDS